MHVEVNQPIISMVILINKSWIHNERIMTMISRSGAYYVSAGQKRSCLKSLKIKVGRVGVFIDIQYIDMIWPRHWSFMLKCSLDTGWSEETVNYKLLIAWARKPEIYTDSSVSLMTYAKERQPSRNNPEEWQDIHSIASYSQHHLTHSTLHVSLYTLRFTHCTLHIEICTLHFTQ